jgi:GT2 family glycosyltransferase
MTTSAVIPVYQPSASILNRCLYLVLPQVDEVIVSLEGKSILPENTVKHPKLTFVHTEERGIGHSRNANFGAKHAKSDWLLILNDDVHLNEDAVAEMLKVIQPDTGIVVHFLRYPDRRIFATVCARKPGDADFHAVDHLKLRSNLPNVIEVENACGASWLIRREAFEKIGGYDEAFFGYSNDNDLSLRMRRAGWKILYCPTAKGWHIGHQSFRKLGDPNILCRPGIELFHKKWKRYLDWNRNRVPGNFDYEQP